MPCGVSAALSNSPRPVATGVGVLQDAPPSNEVVTHRADTPSTKRGTSAINAPSWGRIWMLGEPAPRSMSSTGVQPVPPAGTRQYNTGRGNGTT